MLKEIGELTSEVVKLTLDAAVLRHKIIANNIANANTKGFSPQRLSFESHIANIYKQLNAQDKDSVIGEIKNIRTSFKNGEYIENSNEDPVQLDMEMVKLAENTLRYRAILEGYNKYTSIIKMSISGEGGR